MRIVFAGTPEFARRALQAIIAAGHDVPLVLTQPDRPAGRGLKLTPSPVKQAALAAGIPVAQPRSLRLDGKYPDDARQARQALLDAAPDLMVVAAYGLILPGWTLSLPMHGCFNIHASLLPRWRGAAPIQRAIEAGDAQTGITIMQMDEGLDTGAMLLVRSLPIDERHTAARLHDELAELGAEAIVQAIDDLQRAALTTAAQPAEGVTYAAKLDKSESVLDYRQPAAVLARRIRAFNPAPGSTTRLPGLADPVKVWEAQALTPDQAGVSAQALEAAAPGDVLQVHPEGIDMATGQGVLRLSALQKAGGKRQPVEVFIQGWQQR
ncbi:MAG: methionyl-tRNA formyltransferase [Candidimonas sp.]